MGWARLLFLGNVGQQLDLDVQRAELERLTQQGDVRRLGAERASQALDALRDENQQLKVTIAALVRLLAAKGVLTQAEIETLVTASELSPNS